MKITIEPKLINAVEHLFSEKPNKFQDQSKATKYFTIPIQQRSYSWGEKPEHITALVEDLSIHAATQEENFTNEEYFIGTILLENQNDEFLKVIDGQQRITTLYLVSFLKYLISKCRLEHMPKFAENVYWVRLQNRWQKFLTDEKCIFNHDLETDMTKFIELAEEKPLDDVPEYKNRLGDADKNQLNNYWNNISPRLQFSEETIKTTFLNTLEYCSLQYSDTYNRFDLVLTNDVFEKDNTYFKALKTIIDDVQNLINEDNRDALLDKMHSSLDSILQYSGICGIISENADDSFRLFEILNARGEDLSALDLIKNLILEKTHGEFPNNFATRWQIIKDQVKKSFTRGKQDTLFVENLLKSEGRASTSKALSYLNNYHKTPADDKGNDNEYRLPFFVNKGYHHFFDRLELCSNILFMVNNSNEAYVKDKAFTTFQNIQFMKLINYKWGPQVIIGANLLFQEASINNQNIPNTFTKGSPMPVWLSTNTSWTIDPMGHFLRILSDSMLKLGIFGITTKKQSDILPQTSKKVIRSIVKFIHETDDFHTSENMKKLKDIVLSIIGKVINNESSKEEFRKSLFYYEATSRVKLQLFGVMIYFLYGRNGRINEYINPEREHIEPKIVGMHKELYYQGDDRAKLINRIGNFMLLEKEDNSALSNLPISLKIDKIENDGRFSKSPIYTHPLYQLIKADNSFEDKHYKITKLSTKGRDRHFDDNNAPTKNFFIQRTDDYSRLISDLVCNTELFLNNLEY